MTFVKYLPISVAKLVGSLKMISGPLRGPCSYSWKYNGFHSWPKIPAALLRIGPSDRHQGGATSHGCFGNPPPLSTGPFYRALFLRILERHFKIVLPCSRSIGEPPLVAFLCYPQGHRRSQFTSVRLIAIYRSNDIDSLYWR
jgi:hypothetical protein